MTNNYQTGGKLLTVGEMMGCATTAYKAIDHISYLAEQNDIPLTPNTERLIDDMIGISGQLATLNVELTQIAQKLGDELSEG